MGIERREEGPPGIMEPGRVRREGERAEEGGKGDVERGGGPDPVNLRCVSVKEKMAWEREDWAFMSVSFVRRSDVPCRMSLWEFRENACIPCETNAYPMTSAGLRTETSRSPPIMI
jgi:hypothetical protein